MLWRKVCLRYAHLPRQTFTTTIARSDTCRKMIHLSPLYSTILLEPGYAYDLCLGYSGDGHLQLTCDSEQIFLSLFDSASCSSDSLISTSNLSSATSCVDEMRLSCTTTGKGRFYRPLRPSQNVVEPVCCYSDLHRSAAKTKQKVSSGFVN